jgi:hypothetical protein
MNEGAGPTAREGWRGLLTERLLGALYQRRVGQRLARPVATRLGDRLPIYQWWLFEGREWSVIGGPLGARWADLHRAVRGLLSTHNPRLREEDRPTGEVDWPRTLARGPRWDGAVVVRAGRIGLGDDERDALLGWLGFALAEWRTFATRWSCAISTSDRAALDALTALAAGGAPPVAARRTRWARVATRSRWPLLRELVAPSLRALDEPRDIISLPLPDSDDRLFELVVLALVADALGATWSEVRWFTARALAEDRARHVHIDALSVVWQASLDRGAVLGASIDAELIPVVDDWGLRAHTNIDLLFNVRTIAHVPFDRIAVEVKSGDQGWSDGFWQLRAYGRTLRQTAPGERILALCVAERAPALNAAQQARIAQQFASGAPIVWAFSNPADIATTLRLAGASPDAAVASAPR